MISLQERLAIVSEMEESGCDNDTVEALLECLDGKADVYDHLTVDVIEDIINAKD